MAATFKNILLSLSLLYIPQFSSSHFNRIGDELRTVISFVPNIEKALQFSCINRRCNAIYIDIVTAPFNRKIMDFQRSLDCLKETNDSFADQIRHFHGELAFNEMYSIRCFEYLSHWMSQENRGEVFGFFNELQFDCPSLELLCLSHRVIMINRIAPIDNVSFSKLDPMTKYVRFLQ